MIGVSMSGTAVIHLAELWFAVRVKTPLIHASPIDRSALPWSA